MNAALAFIITTCLFAVCICAQTPVPSRHPGIALYEQAKFSEAIISLEAAGKSKEHKSDANVWNYLGLAYLAKDSVKKGRKAFEKSVELAPTNSVFRANLAYAYIVERQTKKALESADKAIWLDPKNAPAHEVRGVANLWLYKFDAAERDADMFIQLDPQNAQAYLLKSEVLIARMAVRLAEGNAIKDEIGFLKRSIETLELGITRCKQCAALPKLRHELESMTAFYTHFSRDKTVAPISGPSPPAEGVTPFRILEKPRASYTDRARSSNVQGTVRVAVLLGANGKVEHILLLKRLGHGLDEQAIAAARKIKFEPKQKDGKPVSTVVIIEYGFTIY